MAKVIIEYNENYKVEIPVTYGVARAVETLTTRVRTDENSKNGIRTKEDIDVIQFNRRSTKAEEIRAFINGLRTKESGIEELANRIGTKDIITAEYNGYIGKAYGSRGFSIFDSENMEIFHCGFMEHRPENEAEVVQAIKESLELMEEFKKHDKRAAGDREEE